MVPLIRGGGAKRPSPFHVKPYRYRVEVLCYFRGGGGFPVLHKISTKRRRPRQTHTPKIFFSFFKSIYLALRRKRQRFTLAPIPKATKLVTLSKASSILSVLLRHKRLTCSLPCLISVRKDIILPPHTLPPRTARHNYPVTRPLG